MIDQPEILQSPARRAAIIHLVVPRARIQETMGPAHAELTGALAAQGIEPAGPWFTHHLRMDPAIFDYEIGIPIATSIAPTGRVVQGELPAATVVRTVYHGGYEGLSAAWGELDAWIAAQGRTPRADLWERYTAGPESGPDPTAWRTELNRPLAE